MYNAQPGMLGEPRKNRRNVLAGESDHEGDDDDDQPEVDNESDFSYKQLEGLTSLADRYSPTPMSELNVLSCCPTRTSNYS